MGHGPGKREVKIWKQIGSKMPSVEKFASFSWSGVIGALIRDEAEIGVCTFYRTPSRSQRLVVFVYCFDLDLFGPLIAS